MNGAYGYWVGCIDTVRKIATDGDLEVYERQALKHWNALWN